MLTFVTAVFFLMITPGPGVLSLAGVGSGFGYRSGLRYLIGLFLGTNIVALAVITGVAAIVVADERVRTVLLVVSILYLCYLAARIMLSGSRIAFIENAKAPGIMGGIILQALNPKAYVVNSTLFLGFPFAFQSLPLEIALKLLLVNVIWILIHLLWLYGGVSLRRLNISDAAQSGINIAMGVSLLCVVGLAAYSSLSLDAFSDASGVNP